MECGPCDELYVIFKNVGDMFINGQGGVHYTKEYKFGEMFFSKFDGDYDPKYYKYYIVLVKEKNLMIYDSE